MKFYRETIMTKSKEGLERGDLVRFPLDWIRVEKLEGGQLFGRVARLGHGEYPMHTIVLPEKAGLGYAADFAPHTFGPCDPSDVPLSTLALLGIVLAEEPQHT